MKAYVKTSFGSINKTVPGDAIDGDVLTYWSSTKYDEYWRVDLPTNIFVSKVQYFAFYF